MHILGKGTLAWRVDAGAPITTSPTVGPDGCVYVAAGDVLAMGAVGGAVLWRYSLQNGTTAQVCSLRFSFGGVPMPV